MANLFLHTQLDDFQGRDRQIEKHQKCLSSFVQHPLNSFLFAEASLTPYPSYEVFPDRDGSSPIKSAAHFLQSTLLNHTFTVNAAFFLRSSKNFLALTHPNIPLILGEIGSGLAGGNENKTVVRQIESSQGTALWTLDFHLYCMSIGIGGISDQVGSTDWNFAPFNSRPSHDVPTAVRPTWYGMVAAVDFIGNDTSKETRVSHLPPTSKNRSITAYASYRGNDTSRIALLNMRLWDPSISPGSMRPEVTVQLKGLPPGVRSVQVKRLTGPGALQTGNVTWGGESWSFHSRGRPVRVGRGVEVLAVEHGAVDVSVGATEAAVVSLER